MTNLYSVRTLDVTHDLCALDKVMALWRKHAKTLGFFPEGAFKEHAFKKQIIVALDKDESVLGYVLYRVAKQRVSITHLCVDESNRCSGLSRALVNELKKETEGLKGIGLYCRRDYEVSTLWPKLGFVPIAEKVGRGKKTKLTPRFN